MKDELKKLYKKDSKLARKVAKVLGYKIVAKVKVKKVEYVTPNGKDFVKEVSTTIETALKDIKKNMPKIDPDVIFPGDYIKDEQLNLFKTLLNLVKRSFLKVDWDV